MVFHKRKATEFWQLWLDAVEEEGRTADRYLVLLYLANDVLQKAAASVDYNCKIIQEYLLKGFVPLGDGRLQNKKSKVERIVGIWEQRDSLSGSVISSLRQKLGSDATPAEPPSKKARIKSSSGGDDAKASRGGQQHAALHAVDALHKATATVWLIGCLLCWLADSLY